MPITKLKIIQVLKKCIDPELQIDLWNLGLIYKINISSTKNNKKRVQVTMTLTSPACPFGGYIIQEVKNKVEELNKVEECNIKITFDPPWNPEKMSDEAKAKMGYAPLSDSTISPQ
ncbi:metal-sulfur cluster assembly factor [Patescibacteria group bacterium]|nr:metal-sulfur cluster assembly factor [Patescibacteria group bacterium]